jgi:hypothetical protein
VFVEGLAVDNASESPASPPPSVDDGRSLTDVHKIVLYEGFV